jgi:nitrogen fixation protein
MNDERAEAEAEQRGSVRGLRIPADAGSSVSLVVLRLTASELSDAIGGGLLEDALVGDVGGWGYTIWMNTGWRRVWRRMVGLRCWRRVWGT